MKDLIVELFKDSESWRIEMFIDKMHALQREAVINEVGEFANSAKFYAQQLLDLRDAKNEADLNALENQSPEQ
jgi:hypothetical protein